MLDDYLLMEKETEPDLVYLTKRYLTLGYNPLDDRMERGYEPSGYSPFTNDFEHWAIQEREYRQNLRDKSDALGNLRGQYERGGTGQIKRGLVSIQDLMPRIGLGAYTSRYGGSVGGSGGPGDEGGTKYQVPDTGGSGSGGSGVAGAGWPSWSYKWVSYTIPSVPTLKGTTEALAKLKAAPTFFVATLKYLQGSIRVPDWIPPVSKFAFPDPSTITVPDSKMATLDVGTMVAQMNSLLSLLSQTEVAKVITHYTEFDKNITYIEGNLPDWGKYALDTNVERLVRVGRKLPDTLRDALRWMDSSHKLLVNSLTAVRMFESGVVTAFQRLPGQIQAVVASVVANLRNATGSILAQVKTLGSKYTDQVKAYFTELATYIKNWVGSFIGIVKEWVSGLVSTIVTDVGVMRTWLVDVATALGNGIAADITIVSEWVRSVFAGFSTNISGNMTTLGGSMDQYTRGLVSAFMGEVTAVQDAVVSKLKEAGAILKEEFGVDLAAARKEFTSMVSALSSDLKAGYQELKESLSSAKAEVVSLTKNITDLVDIVDALKTRSDETMNKVQVLDDRANLKFAEIEEAIKQLQSGQVPKSQGTFFNRLFGFVG